MIGPESAGEGSSPRRLETSMSHSDPAVSLQVTRPVTQAFLRRMTAAGTALTATFTVLFLVAGDSWPATFVVAAGCVGFHLLYRSVHRPSVPYLLMILSWMLTGALDDGFSGRASSWMFLIPITLAGWTLFANSRFRWVVLGMPFLLTGFANTPFAPLVTLPLADVDPRYHHALHFVGAFLASIFCVQHLLEMENGARMDLDRARERAEKASRAKDEFLSHMSHEFRTPLNAINGFTELLSTHLQQRAPATGDSPESVEECGEHLGAIRSATEHLVHLVEDILDLSRLESGEIRLNIQSFSPELLLTDVRSSLQGRATERKQTLVLVGGAAIPRLMGDRVRWKQILLNLVGNAIKFSPPGEVRVVSDWTDLTETRGRLEVRVTDQGPGIPPELQDRIFERFVRAEAVERAGTTGTGLGLAISRNLARAMGGDIVLESSSKDGSTFLCTIPFPIAEPEDPGSGVYTRIARPTLKGKRVLLCEDNRLNIRLATKLLDRLEAIHELAEDGGQAMDRLRSGTYDLVLLDLHMPVADGFEVAAFVRGPDGPEGNRAVPILALTADAFEETRHRAKAAGMDDFLAKPYSFEDLASKSMRLIEQRARTR